MSLDHCCLSGGHGTFQIMPDPIQFGYFTILYQVWHWKHVLRMQCLVTVYAPLGRQSPTKNQNRSVVVRSNLHIADWKKTYPFTSPESFQKNCIWIVEAFQMLMFFLQITDFCFFLRSERGFLDHPFLSVTCFSAVQGRRRIVAMVSGIACDASRSRTLAGWPRIEGLLEVFSGLSKVFWGKFFSSWFFEHLKS